MTEITHPKKDREHRQPAPKERNPAPDRTKYPPEMSKVDADALARIEQCIASPPENSRRFIITPPMASYIIDKYNTANRPRKPKKIAEYADDMADQQWKITGDTVKFSDSKQLGDGQNRLFACIKSGKPFETHIMFGIPQEFFPWLDRGKPRNGADTLHCLGEANTNILSAGLRWLELIRLGKAKDRISFTPSQIAEAFDTYDSPRLRAAVDCARRVWATSRAPKGMVTALAYHAFEIDADLAAQFFGAWEKGIFATRTKALEKAILELKDQAEQNLGRVHEVGRMAAYILAWNHVVADRRGHKTDYRWKRTDEFPIIVDR